MNVAEIPDSIDEYRILRRVAYGGMAEVFLGELTGADGFTKRVVIKRVLPQHCENEEFLRMFRDEARITSRLQHGNIVQVLNFGEAEGQHYLVLEFVDGPSLRELLRKLRRRGEKLSIPEAAHVVAEVARALDYAHRKRGDDGTSLQIVHRDVSPSNVLVSREGEVKLVDFGIARARARLSPTREGTGLLKGKLGYMAPETVMHGHADARSDLFALGVVAYELLTGEAPFAGNTEADTIHRVLEGRAPGPRELDADVPPEVDALVTRLLAREPEERPARALEVLEPLGSLPGSETLAAADRVAQRVRRLFPPGQHGWPRTESPTPSVRPPSTRQSVLVVDESRTMRAVLRAILSSHYAVSEAASLDEALEVVRRDRPQAVLCQRRLSEAPGLDLCRRIREDPETGAVTFVLLAAEVSPELTEEAERAGAEAVLPKQADAATLLERLRVCMAGGR